MRGLLALGVLCAVGLATFASMAMSRPSRSGPSATGAAAPLLHTP